MLYTFAKAQYDQRQLYQILDQITDDDALLLWQDGVLQAVKYPDLFANVPNLFILATDLNARGLHTDFSTVSLADAVLLTERYFPQIAL